MTVLHQVIAGFVILIGLGCLAALAGLSPAGWSRLRHIGLWLTVLGAFLPPTIFVLMTFRTSEDPALWMVLGMMFSCGAAVVGYLIGLFLPATVPFWTNLGLGLGFWLIAGLVLYFAR